MKVKIFFLILILIFLLGCRQFEVDKNVEKAVSKGKGITIEFIPNLVPKQIDVGREYLIGVNMINPFMEGVEVEYLVKDDFGEFMQEGGLRLEPSFSEEGFGKGEQIFRGIFSSKPFGKNINPNEPINTFFTAEVLYNRKSRHVANACIGDFNPQGFRTRSCPLTENARVLNNNEAINLIKAEKTLSDEIKFELTFQNAGGGEIIGDKAGVYIMDEEGNINFECDPEVIEFEEGIGKTNCYAKFYLGEQEFQEKVFFVDLNYNYKYRVESGNVKIIPSKREQNLEWRG